jgi:recombinational DNA repair protein (RecF pathway)
MYYQLKGLVLRSKVSAEADKLITLYTCEWGKITAIVPGAKKVKAKFSAIAEPVTESEFMVYMKHQSVRPKVTGAKMVEGFPALRKNWRNFSIAAYCAEICDKLTPFNSENSKKYELLQRTWELLGQAQNPWRIYTAFVLRFLKLSGYNFYEFIINENVSMPEKELRAIQNLSTLSGQDLDKNYELSRSSEESVRRYIDAYLLLYLSRPLSSREFFRKVHNSQRISELQETTIVASLK